MRNDATWQPTKIERRLNTARRQAIRQMITFEVQSCLRDLSECSKYATEKEITRFDDLPQTIIKYTLN
eukprot:796520-Amphidinium_carterae.1